MNKYAGMYFRDPPKDARTVEAFLTLTLSYFAESAFIGVEETPEWYPLIVFDGLSNENLCVQRRACENIEIAARHYVDRYEQVISKLLRILRERDGVVFHHGAQALRKMVQYHSEQTKHFLPEIFEQLQLVSAKSKFASEAILEIYSEIMDSIKITTPLLRYIANYLFVTYSDRIESIVRALDHVDYTRYMGTILQIRDRRVQCLTEKLPNSFVPLVAGWAVSKSIGPHNDIIPKMISYATSFSACYAATIEGMIHLVRGKESKSLVIEELDSVLKFITYDKTPAPVKYGCTLMAELARIDPQRTLQYALSFLLMLRNFSKRIFSFLLVGVLADLFYSYSIKDSLVTYFKAHFEEFATLKVASLDRRCRDLLVESLCSLAKKDPWIFVVEGQKALVELIIKSYENPNLEQLRLWGETLAFLQKEAILVDDLDSKMIPIAIAIGRTNVWQKLWTCTKFCDVRIIA